MTEVKYLDKTGLTSVWSKVKGIVTPKADKVSGATAGHLAGLNSGGNLTDSGLPASNIAQKDGSYSGMTVGAAEDLVSAESVASEFTSRITGGSTAVGKGGTALVDKIKGRTLVWNQMVQNGDFSNGLVGWTLGLGVTASVSGNVCTITASDTSSSIRTSLYAIAGHKYYFSMVINSAVRGNVGYFSSPTQWLGQLGSDDINKDFRFSNIVTANNSTIYLFVGAYSTQAGNSFTISNVQCIDLTLLFGAGSEPATPEEFEALYPGLYYDYNPGTLISNAATAIETVGFNQWDEEWEVGAYDNGIKITDNSCIRSKNYIRVLPNTSYYIKFPAVGRVSYYNAAKTFLTSDTGYNTTKTTPNDCYYITFHVSSTTKYANDICVNLSDPSRNGTYEPYWRSELELGLGDIKVKSHNLWDEEWENGEYNATTGEKAAAGSYIRCKNRIPVLPNTSYYITHVSGGNTIFSYDGAGNYIGVVSKTNNIFTTPGNAAYVTFNCYTAYGSTYLDDICINLSDTAFNGRYEPYGDGGVISITGGLKSAGTVYDEISGGKLIKRIESVDLGTKSWVYDSSGAYFYSDAPQGIKSVSLSSKGNVLCAKYGTVDGSSQSSTDKTVSIGYKYVSNGINIRDSSYTDAATFKAAMSGVPLYYELATPIEYELAEAIPTAMRNDPYGTERRLPEDTAAIVTAPFRADITYSTNIKEAVQSMPQNYINVNSMQDFLAALGTLMGGTWTMRQADGKFDFTFTPNPSNE